MTKGNGTTGVTSSIRDRIGAAQQVTKELLEVSEWGVTLEIRGITLGQRSRIMREGYTPDDKPRPIFEVFYPLLLMASVYDPSDSKPVFADSDAQAINELNPAVVDRVARVAMRLSGLSAAEDAEKNVGGGNPTSTTAISSAPNLVA